MRYLCLLLACSLSWTAFAKDRPDIGTLAAKELLVTGRQAIANADWQGALEVLREAVREDPSNADAHNLLAYAYRKQDTSDLAKAFEHYKAALTIDPQHRGAHEYLGEAYLMAGQPEKAKAHLLALENICGDRQCEEYKDLAQAIADDQSLRGKP